MESKEWLVEYSGKYEWLNIDTSDNISKYNQTNIELGEDLGFKTLGVFTSREDAESGAIMNVTRNRLKLSESSTRYFQNLLQKKGYD